MAKVNEFQLVMEKVADEFRSIRKLAHDNGQKVMPFGMESVPSGDVFKQFGRMTEEQRRQALTDPAVRAIVLKELQNGAA